MNGAPQRVSRNYSRGFSQNGSAGGAHTIPLNAPSLVVGLKGDLVVLSGNEGMGEGCN